MSNHIALYRCIVRCNRDVGHCNIKFNAIHKNIKNSMDCVDALQYTNIKLTTVTGGYFIVKSVSARITPPLTYL